MRLLFIFILLLASGSVICQVNATDVDSLLTAYKQSKPDTNRVKILLQLDTIYVLRKGSKSNILDSAILLSQQVRNLSTNLHFKSGYEDAAYLLSYAYKRKGDIAAAVNVMKECSHETGVSILINVGEYYTFKPGQLDENLDSAYPYIMKAIALSRSIKSVDGLHSALRLLGKYYYERGDFIKGKDCFMQVIHDCQVNGDKNKEAFWWEEAGIYMPDSDSTFPYEVNAYQNARSLLHWLGNVAEEKSVLGNLSYIYQRHGMLDSAEILLLEEIRLGKQIGRKDFSLSYNYLTEISLAKGNYNTSIFYSIQAIKCMDSSKKYDYAGVLYFHLADAYRELGETDQSLTWYKASLQNLETEKAEYIFTVARRISGALIIQHKPTVALTFLQHFIAENKAPRYSDKEAYAAAMGDCYNALKQYDNAEKYYHQMIAFDSLARKQRVKEIFGVLRSATLLTSEANFIIGRFYIERKKYQLASSYLNNALVKDIFEPSLIQLRDIFFLRFKADSAQENYLAAINEFARAKSLNDSVFNITKNKQIQELQVAYDVAQKQQQLQVLAAKEQLQTKELQKTQQSRDFTYAFLIILLIVIAIGYSRYMLKQKTNKQLEVQQQEINQKNAALENLLKEKDGLINDKDVLLEEKEWLVKEIHHRVKNNLQIVISLLSTQSKYLDNEEAIAAINESSHRMQAMSFIHQKLYQHENTRSVNMKTYITELSDYLKTSFKSGKEINFLINVDEILLDISHAIPIGLILNEVITNAIKYAFEEREAGSVYINMHHIGNNKIFLNIKDNGIGLPDNIDLKNSTSMGMRLVNGLTKQINGKLNFENKGGVGVQVEFINDIKLTSIGIE